jgi:hypothetical protein
MKPKIHTPSPSESSGDLPSQKPKKLPPEKTGRKAGGQRNWRDGSMIGQKFGSLTVIGIGKSNGIKPVSIVPCKCDCGEEVFCASGHLIKGVACRKCGNLKISKANSTHGQRKSPEYRVWVAMKNRCLNVKSSNWPNYGGRGISVCDEWKRFENFMSDMGQRPSLGHTIDRLDNSKGYSKENCRWATKAEQTRNRSISRKLTVKGETKTLGEWAEQYGMLYGTLQDRIYSGWAHEDAVLTPIGKRRPSKNEV